MTLQRWVCHNVTGLACVVLSVVAPADAVAGREAETTLTAMSQALLDAVGSGERSVFERTLAKDGLFTDEDGIARSKSELIAEIHALPDGVSGRIRLTNAKTSVIGGAAVVSFDALEDVSYYGQSLHTRFHTTDVYQRRDKRWQLIASQTTAIPSEPHPYSPPDPPSGLTGTYQVAPGRVARVSVVNGEVLWSRNGNPAVRLLGLGGDVYFQPGVLRGLKIFVRDKEWRASYLVDRRDNNDIIWQKLSD